MISPRIRPALACPACRGPLRDATSEALRCPSCRVDFPVRNGVPVLHPPGGTESTDQALAEWRAGEIRPGISWNTLRRIQSPPAHAWWEEEREVRKVCRAAPEGALLLDVGCGLARLDPRVCRLDIGYRGDIDVVGDIRSLPLAADSVDGIFCLRVLEHVPSPEAAVAEIFRVLRPGGFVFAVVPFLQPYHRNPVDHSRYCRDGLDHLFRQFRIERIEWTAGPASTLLWILKEFLALLLPFSHDRYVYAGLRELAGWVLYPLKLLDFWFRYHPLSHKIACEFLILGRKPEGEGDSRG